MVRRERGGPCRPRHGIGRLTKPLPLSPDGISVLGDVLSPSQVKVYLDCSARWWFKHGLGLPDPAGASLVRGRVLHRVAEAYFRARLAGATPEVEELGQTLDTAWDEACATAVFQTADNLDALKRQTGELTRLYLEEVAPEIQPAAVEQSVTGRIGGVQVRGFIDLMDVDGRIIDIKTASRKPSGIAPDYALQLATYRHLAPGASGQVRLDTIVATKTPQIVTLPYEVSAADMRMAEVLYPHVQEGIREGLFFPNRCSNLCSRRTCAFADACEHDFGGSVQ